MANKGYILVQFLIYLLSEVALLKKIQKLAYNNWNHSCIGLMKMDNPCFLETPFGLAPVFHLLGFAPAES